MYVSMDGWMYVTMDLLQYVFSSELLPVSKDLFNVQPKYIKKAANLGHTSRLRKNILKLRSSW
jgi:hypothetical protein